MRYVIFIFIVFLHQGKLTKSCCLCAVGEPINTEAWEWYHQVVGDGRCPVVDTWWQTGIKNQGTNRTVAAVNRRQAPPKNVLREAFSHRRPRIQR